MTQVGRLFEEEKQEALRELERKMKRAHRQTLKRTRRESKMQNSKQIARRMLEKGMTVSEVQSVITNLSYDEINALKEQIRN